MFRVVDELAIVKYGFVCTHESFLHQLGQFALFFFRQHGSRVGCLLLLIRRGFCGLVYRTLKLIGFEGPLADGSIDPDTDNR